MTKRRLVLPTVALIIILVVSFVGWMAGTGRGNHFVLKTIIKFVPAKIDIGKVSGILTDSLKIDGLCVRFGDWEIRVGAMEVSLQAGYLTAGDVVFRHAFFSDVKIIDNNPEAPVDIRWPKAPGWFSMMNGRIKNLAFDQIVIYSRDKEKTRLGNFKGEVLLRFGTLSIKKGFLKASFGVNEGNADIGLVRPALAVNIKLMPPEPAGIFQRFDIAMNLKASKKPEHVSGDATVSVESDTKNMFSLKGNIALTNKTVKFKDMLLTENGRQGEMHIDGVLDFASYNSVFDLDMYFSNINLLKELTVKTSLSGNLHVKGNTGRYNGSIIVKNVDSTWKDINLKSSFEGDLKQIQLNEITGGFLNGTLKGLLQMSWTRDFFLTAELKCRGFDPSKIAPYWKGAVNADAFAAFRWPDKKPLEGTMKAEFLQSVLRNKALTGKLDAAWNKGVLSINKFGMRGDGFDLNASGILEDRLNFEARVSNLSGLVPDSQGRLLARGWTRMKNEKISGALKGSGSSLCINGIHAGSASVEAEIDGSNENRINAKVKADSIIYSGLKVSKLAIDIEGRIIQHVINVMLMLPENNIRSSFSGGYKNGAWDGSIYLLEAKSKDYGLLKLVKPSPLKLSSKHFRLGAASLINSSSPEERIDADVQLDMQPLLGSARVKLQELNIARLNPFISKIRLYGNVSGSADGHWLPDKKMKLTGTLTVNRASINGSAAINVNKAGAHLKWDEKGLDSSCNLDFDSGGGIQIKIASNQPARIGMPESGEISGNWKEINMNLFKPWIPEAFELKGNLSGKLTGRFLPGSHFNVSGESKMSNGRLIWKKEGGRIAFSTEKADMGFVWKESHLKGKVAFVLPSHGNINGDFQLPIPASLPFKIDSAGEVKIECIGKIREKGVVSAVFPGMIEETRGLADYHVTASGTWQNPEYKGWLKLEQAGAFLPVPGVQLKDLTVEAELNKDHINLTSFSAVSGKGSVNGSATVWLKDWKIDHYKGKLTGNRFQAVYVPEIQLMVNPDLTFEGDPKNLSVRGSVEVPEATISQGKSKGATRASSDVNVIGAPQKIKKPLKFNFDAKVMVILGDKVLINAPGIEAKLEGRVLLSGQSIDKIVGEGQIRIAKGQYSGYGTKLDVTRGNIDFSGKPVELASLDIMALRPINPGRFNEIKAGVTITGTPKTPLINLYSEPSMSDTDILSYIVLGRPIRSEGETAQSAILLRSAGAFISGGKSGSLQSKLMQKIGIDTFDVETKTTTGVAGEGVGTSGSGTRTGTAAGSATSGTTMTRSLVTVGKYIAPGLYVAYGRSLFTEEYLITTRYSFTRRFEIESKTGIETGVDVYYKIEFD